MGSFAQKVRVVVAMWIFVGFSGSLLTGFFSVMALTGTGLFQDRAHINVRLEFPPGEEVSTHVSSMGDFLVLAYPETIDPSTVECTNKSRVYSTGTQHVDEVLIEKPDGVTDTMSTRDSPPRQFVPLALVDDWMGTSFITCTGEGVESFALASGKDLHPDSFRYGIGGALLVLSPVLFGLGFLALHLTRKWSRQESQGMYRHRQQYGQPPQYGQPQPHPYQQPSAQQPPGQNPYAAPPGPHE